MSAETKRPLIWAHTGDKYAAPENTLAAFRAGLEAGADGVELDVHLTADGHVVVLHDSSVDRTTDGSGFVAEMMLKDIRSLDAGFKHSAAFQGERIPTLKEVLDLVLSWPGGDRRVLIELKGPVSGLTALFRTALMRFGPFPHPYGKLAATLVDTLAPFRADVEVGRIWAQSFHLPYLLELQTLLPKLQVLYLSPMSSAGFVETANLRGNNLGLAGVAVMHLSVSTVGVRTLQKRQGKVFIWTPDSPKAIRAAIVRGVDGIITNRPAEALKVWAELSSEASSSIWDDLPGSTLDWYLLVGVVVTMFLGFVMCRML